jgi:DnaJ-domain-containing protein 1
MSLFDNTAPTATEVVHIAKPEGAHTLTKEQKAFNRLIKQIEDQRKVIEDWQAVMPAYHTKMGAEFTPLVEACSKFQAQLVVALDRGYGVKGLTKTENSQLRDLIPQLAGQVLEDDDDAEMSALYEKYRGKDHEEEQEDIGASMKAMIESMLGIDLGDGPTPKSPEELMRMLSEKSEEIEAAQAARQPPKRKPTAKALAKQAKEEEEAQHISQSIREIYRKLASSLHPDRETDDQERERKTALMQQVNAAYDKKDLLKLLELQLKIEQIDHASIAQVADTRLKHYNKILTEQLQELRQEVAFIEMRISGNASPFAQNRVTPKNALRQLNAEIAGLKLELKRMEREVQSVASVQGIKAWLKEHCRPARRGAFEFPF